MLRQQFCLSRLLLCFGVVVSAMASAQEPTEQTMSDQVQDVKQQVLELNKDLFILEEDLLYPANTQVAVYVSLDVGYLFSLDAVKLTIDGDVVANYLYTERQVDALQRGGIQRLYTGNIKSGKHDVVAVFTGRGPHGRDFRRATNLQFSKGPAAKNIELKIIDSTAKQQPEFAVKEW